MTRLDWYINLEMLFLLEARLVVQQVKVEAVVEAVVDIFFCIAINVIARDLLKPQIKILNPQTISIDLILPQTISIDLILNFDLKNL
jgi:hypothetical protein